MNMRVCTLCVMDESDPQITFNREGVCNHCLEAEKVVRNFIYRRHDSSDLDGLFKVINKGSSKYDSLIGLSGGLDSTYVAMLAHKYQLNPLCVHFDNGWNSAVAVRNIKKIIDTTGWDYETIVINWPDFRSLQRAYLIAGVVDIEVCTDHAIFATMINLAKAEKIKYILSGTNFSTEHGMPISWTWHKLDRINLIDINKKFGTKELKSYPTTSTISWLFMRKFGIGVKFLEPLNKINYKLETAQKDVIAYFDWEDYGGKHHESIFTKFYQNHILPTKFKVDKRKVHLSALIRSGQMSQEHAINELSIPLYSKAELKRDKEFVLKKLGFSDLEFDELMNSTPINHDFYQTDRLYIEPLLKLASLLGIKGFYG